MLGSTVLEVAIGTGRNLPFYAPGVHLTGVEFSPAMLELASRQFDLSVATNTQFVNRLLFEQEGE